MFFSPQKPSYIFPNLNSHPHSSSVTSVPDYLLPSLFLLLVQVQDINLRRTSLLHIISFHIHHHIYVVEEERRTLANNSNTEHHGRVQRRCCWRRQLKGKGKKPQLYGVPTIYREWELSRVSCAGLSGIVDCFGRFNQILAGVGAVLDDTLGTLLYLEVGYNE